MFSINFITAYNRRLLFGLNRHTFIYVYVRFRKVSETRMFSVHDFFGNLRPALLSVHKPPPMTAKWFYWGYLKKKNVLIIFYLQFQSCIIAIVVPEVDVIKSWAQENGISGTLSVLCANPEVKKLIMDDMTAWGKDGGLKSFEQVLSTTRTLKHDLEYIVTPLIFFFFVFPATPGERRLPAPGSVLRAKRTVDAHVQNETSAGQVVLCAANRRHVHQVEVITADDGDSTTRVRTKPHIVNQTKKPKTIAVLAESARRVRTAKGTTMDLYNC